MEDRSVLFFFMSEKYEMIRNYFYNLIWQLSAIIIPLITVPYLTRVIGAKGLGNFSMAYSMAYYFTIFIKLGVDNYGSREIAYNRNSIMDISKTFWEIFLFQILLGILITVIYSIWIIFFIKNNYLSFIMIALLLSAMIDTNWCVYGLEQFGAAAKRDILIKCLVAILIFVFVKSEDDVWAYALIYVLGTVLTQIISLSVIAKYIIIVPISIKGIGKHIIPNMKMLFPVLTVSIYVIMDKIMIGVLACDEELGFYHTAENIIKVPMAFITALGTIMMPRISNMVANKGRKDMLNRLFEWAFVFAVFISVSLCYGIMCVTKEFVPLFFGTGFEKCVNLFYVFLPSTIFTAVSSVIRTQIILPQKMDGLYFLSLLSGALTNLSINFALIPRLGALGAAIGSLITYITICCVQIIGVRNQLNLYKLLLISISMIAPGIIGFLLLAGNKFGNGSAIKLLVNKIFICGAFYILVMLFEFGLLLITNVVSMKKLWSYAHCFMHSRKE